MNNKFITKIVSIIICAFMAFSALAGCADTSSTPPTEPQNPPATPTQDYLVEKANSNYDIVIASDASETIVTASIELQTLFEEATSIKLDIIRDDGLTHSKDNTYLSIGKNALSESANFTVSATEVKSQGFKIKTIDKTIYMLGATDRGSLYAVYEFLALEFNFEHFFTDVYDIEKNVTDRNLNSYDVVEIPDIDQMGGPNTGYLQYIPQNANRMRVIPWSGWSIPQNTYNAVHNIMEILPAERFNKPEKNPDEYHPDWYVDGDEKLTCFSAHTDLEDILNPYSDPENPTEYDYLLDAFLEVIQNGVKKSDAEIFSISQEDNVSFCPCDYCTEISQTYKANSALLVLLCNNLSDKMAEWFETPEGAPYKRDLKILLFAYQETESAPVNYNSKSKTYEPSAPEMKCRDNVGVHIAPLGIYSTYDLDYSINQEFTETVISWRALTDKFAFWIYDVNFSHYFYPYDSFVVRQDLYKFLAEAGTMVLNDQGQTQNIGSCTAWDNLKSYLETKLRWDTDADLAALTRRYFDFCYKSAADTMYSLYIQTRAYSNEMKQKFANGEYSGLNAGNIGHIFGGINNKQLWAKSTLERWCNEYLTAFEELKQIEKTDPDGYEKAYKMICAEAASPLYILIDLYQDEGVYAEQTVKDMKAKFKEYCTDAGINSYLDSTLSGGIENLYAKWGIE